jgi:hypothetical protein
MSLNEIKIPKNMNNQKEELESKNLDHLGIIAGIIADGMTKMVKMQTK